MNAPVLPWLSGPIIALLADDADFAATCGGRVAGRTPSDASTPYATVRTLTNTPVSGRSGAWRATSRITGWCPPATSDTAEDPFLVAWRIAATAAAVFGPLENRQQSYQDLYWKPVILQGPTEEVDTSRGPEAPMYGCSIELELSVKTES